ncbi:MAG: hypothetical protein WCO02_16975 [Bacteroidota bacterium]
MLHRISLKCLFQALLILLATSACRTIRVENFSINGQVNRLEPEKIQITPQSVKAYFVLSGKVRVVLSCD